MKNLAIVGSAPSTRGNVDWNDKNLDIWVYNEVISHQTWCKRADGVFQMHPRESWNSPVNRADPNHPLWLKNTPAQCNQCHGTGKYIKEGNEIDCDYCGGNGTYTPTAGRESTEIFMIESFVDVPNSTRFPDAEIVEALLPGLTVDSERARKDFFTSSTAYAIALGIYRGYKKIDLFGIELADEEEYRAQLPAAMFWMGVAVGKGIELTAHSNMFDAPRYGIESYVGFDKNNFVLRIAELAPQCTELQKEYAKVKELADQAIKNFEEVGSGREELEKAVQARAEAGQKFGVLDGARQENERYLSRVIAMEKASGAYVFSVHEFKRDRDNIGMERQKLMQQWQLMAARCVEILNQIDPKKWDSVRRHQFKELREAVEMYNRASVIIGMYTGAMQEDEHFIDLMLAERAKIK